MIIYLWISKYNSAKELEELKAKGLLGKNFNTSDFRASVLVNKVSEL